MPSSRCCRARTAWCTQISKLGRGKRIGKVEDVVNVGDKIQVEIAEIDQRGKISLVLVDESPATEPGAAVAAE